MDNNSKRSEQMRIPEQQSDYVNKCICGHFKGDRTPTMDDEQLSCWGCDCRDFKFEQPVASKTTNIEQRIDELLVRFGVRSIVEAPAHGWDKLIEEAKQQLLSLIAEERLDELTTFIPSNNKFGRDSAYSDVPFYVVETRTYEERQAELQAQIKGVNHE